MTKEMLEQALEKAKAVLEQSLTDFYVSNEATSEEYQSFIIEVSLKSGGTQE